MTENTILKDGKLQLATLAEVIRDKRVELSEQGLVLVATMSASGCAFDADELHPNDEQGIAIRMMGAGLIQLVADAMTQEPEALAVVAKYYGMSQRRVKFAQWLGNEAERIQEQEGEQDDEQ